MKLARNLGFALVMLMTSSMFANHQNAGAAFEPIFKAFGEYDHEGDEWRIGTDGLTKFFRHVGYAQKDASHNAWHLYTLMYYFDLQGHGNGANSLPDDFRNLVDWLFGTKIKMITSLGIYKVKLSNLSRAKWPSEKKIRKAFNVYSGIGGKHMNVFEYKTIKTLSNIFGWHEGAVLRKLLVTYAWNVLSKVDFGMGSTIDLSSSIGRSGFSWRINWKGMDKDKYMNFMTTDVVKGLASIKGSDDICHHEPGHIDGCKEVESPTRVTNSRHMSNSAIVSSFA